MQTLLGKLGILLGGLTLLLSAYLGGVNDSKNTVLGGAANGLPATIATSTVLTVGTTAITVWSTDASNGSCSSRVITTTGKPIMISFGNRPNYPAGNRATSTASATQGHYQAASTTVAYDASIYGCGTVGIYGFDAASTITVSQFE